VRKQQPTSSDRLTYSVDETAALLGVSRSMAYECIRRGEIPAIRFGRRVLVPRMAIDELLGHAPSPISPGQAYEQPATASPS
jgi:excisionase family DNA binding protein